MGRRKVEKWKKRAVIKKVHLTTNEAQKMEEAKTRCGITSDAEYIRRKLFNDIKPQQNNESSQM